MKFRMTIQAKTINMVKFFIQFCFIYCNQSCQKSCENERLVINEESLNQVSIENSLLTVFHEENPCFSLERVIAHQDGPSIIAYNLVLQESDRVGTINMKFEDENEIDKIMLFSEIVMDEYGLKIGDTFADIEKRRVGNITWVTDFSQTTYVLVEGSKLKYSIFGDFDVSTKDDPENLTFGREEILNWEIEMIVWSDTGSPK